MEKHDPDDDVVAIYLREVATNKPLTRDEERRMFQELGNKDDRDETRENIERILIENCREEGKIPLGAPLPFDCNLGVSVGNPHGSEN